jgi:hydroxymethylglutaryl-CoA lyase
MLPKHVKVVEVGPRDGLQNEKVSLNTQDKLKLIRGLQESGLSYIEIGSLVSEKSVPQMSNTEEVLDELLASKQNKYSDYTVLVPNSLGMQRLNGHTNITIAVFTSVSETFSQKNINCSIAESLTRFKEVFKTARQKNIAVRGYLSCVLGCPYEGVVDINKVVEMSEQLINMGCCEISLGDTIGFGSVKQVQELIKKVSAKIDINKIAVHFHDTYGQALVNVYSALEMGVHIVDSSVAGLGGCPYAKGSSGNLATEDLVYMLNGLGIETGVDLDKLIKVGHEVTKKLDILPRSKLSLAKL